MKLLSLLLVAILSVSFFAGCSEDSTPTNDYTIQQVFPLKVGNLWQYHAREINEDGSVRDEYTTTMEVDSAITFNGIPAFAGKMFDQEGILYYQNSELYGAVGSNPTLILKYPMAIDQPVITKDTTMGQTRYISYLVLRSNNEKVTVPAGTFNALHYDMIRVNITTFIAGSTIDTSSISSSYFAVNVGLVKAEDNSYSGGTKHLIGDNVLQTYELK